MTDDRSDPTPDAVEPGNRDTDAASDPALDETANGGDALIGEGADGDPVSGGEGADLNDPVDTGLDGADAQAVEEAENRGDGPDAGQTVP
jgi:hypothetical protein